ncbi:MAG TPA: hypothetical protein VK536_10345 [Candidatus Limnocylindrales bacterium]|nr:hypothetical protein [Candidatus Limnocylindrales bacterium]
MSNPQQAIEFYASMNYGHLISITAPIYDEKEELYISNLFSDYPLVIKNEKPPETKTLHIMEIKSLGYITSDKNGRIIKDRTTSRDECIRNILSFFELWKRRAEEIVVYATSDKLVQGLRWYHFLDPIDEIVSQLWESNGIDEFEIDYGRSKQRRQKTRQYLALLEGLEIVTKQGNNYFEGNLTITAREKAKGDKHYFRDLLVSTVLKERYSTLRDVFHLSILDPVVRVDNCVYLPEIETEEQIYRSLKSIRIDYKNYYHHLINKEALKRHLDQLVDFKIIEQKGQHYFGNKALRDVMIEKKKELGSINKALMARA